MTDNTTTFNRRNLDPKEKEKLYQSYRGYLQKLSLPYTRTIAPSYDKSDIDQCLALAFFSALEECREGASRKEFHTLLGFKVKDEITELSRASGSVHIPEKKFSLMNKVGKVYARTEDVMATAEELDMTTDDVREALRMRRMFYTNQLPVSGEEDDEEQEVPDGDSEEREDEFLLSESIKAMLLLLGPMERKIIRLHFGFQGEELTPTEIGRRLGISPYFVRKSLSSALDTMRRIA